MLPWFKVDDRLHDHEKVHAAELAAMGLWVLAGSWSMEKLTDGFVPERVLPRWGSGARRAARRLVEAGLWVPAETDGKKGFRFHDWGQYQPLAKTIEAEREAARLRMQAKRAAKAESTLADVQANVQPNVRANNPGTSGERSPRVLDSRPDPSLPVLKDYPDIDHHPDLSNARGKNDDDQNFDERHNPLDVISAAAAKAKAVIT